MSQSIHIEIDRLEGTLLRILGLIERRGFHIDAIELFEIDAETRGLSVTVRPRDAGRSLDTLGLQIDRLYGIKRLEHAPERAQNAAAAAAEKLSA
ncbi:MAG: ACT domain-containing protein [Asticcacaulis sp.]